MKSISAALPATNKDLEKLIEEGKFRPDLFYRLNVFRIELPPLRERRDDIPVLVDHFVRKFSLAMNKRITRVSASAMNQMQQQPWLGNVRELENAVERAMVVGQEPELREEDFIFKTQSVSPASSKSLEEMERAHILRVLEECGGNFFYWLGLSIGMHSFPSTGDLSNLWELAPGVGPIALFRALARA